MNPRTSRHTPIQWKPNVKQNIHTKLKWKQINAKYMGIRGGQTNRARGRKAKKKPRKSADLFNINSIQTCTTSTCCISHTHRHISTERSEKDSAKKWPWAVVFREFHATHTKYIYKIHPSCLNEWMSDRRWSHIHIQMQCHCLADVIRVYHACMECFGRRIRPIESEIQREKERDGGKENEYKKGDNKC